MKTVKFKLLPYQMQMLQSKANRVALIAGRGTGKSVIASIVAAKALIEGHNVMCWAQNFAALRDNLMKEICKKLYEMIGDNFNFNKQAMQVEYNGHYIYGFSYVGIESCRGYTNISYCIFDEGALAPKSILETAIPCMRGEGIIPHIYWTTTPRYDSWLTQYLKENPDIEVIRAATMDNTFLSKESIKVMMDSIPSEQMRRQEIFGEDIAYSDNAIVNLSEFNDQPIKALDDYNIYVGADCSGAGKDYNAIVIRTDRQILDIYKVVTASSSDLFTYIDRKLSIYGPERLVEINLDMAYGQALFERLEAKYPTNLIPFGGRLSNIPDQYKNNRAFMYFNLVNAIREGFIIDDTEVKRNLTYTTYKLTDGDSKIILNPKEELKEIIGHSPDVEDALALTFAKINTPATVRRVNGKIAREDNDAAYFSHWMSSDF